MRGYNDKEDEEKEDEGGTHICVYPSDSIYARARARSTLSTDDQTTFPNRTNHSSRARTRATTSMTGNEMKKTKNDKLGLEESGGSRREERDKKSKWYLL